MGIFCCFLHFRPLMWCQSSAVLTFSWSWLYSGMPNVFFLGLQYVFFRVVVAAHFYYTFLITIPYILGYQTCFSGIAMHVFSEWYTIWIQFPIHNSIYSGMPNVFYWGCNARFSERCAKHVFLGLQCAFFSEWYTLLIQFPNHNILFEENKKNSVCSINIFAACYSTRLRAYIFENCNQINLGFDPE